MSSSGVISVGGVGRGRHARATAADRCVQVHPASVQDRDGAVPLLQASRPRLPFVELAFADTAYAGDRVADATSIAVEIVRKPPDQVGFASWRGGVHGAARMAAWRTAG